MQNKSLQEIHDLLMESVREENKKQNEEFSNSIFNINSKRNLIAIAKESLKPKPIKLRKTQINFTPVKINKSFQKKIINISPKKENLTKNIFTDKQYLNFILNDLHFIYSNMKRRQNKLNPINLNNDYLISRMKKGNKYKSYGVTKRRHFNIINLKTNFPKKPTMINLLSQIIGDNNINGNDKYEDNTTENNRHFNNLCYDNIKKKYYIKEKVNKFN